MAKTSLTNSARNGVRRVAHAVAGALNHLSGGKITPNGITVFGFLMHIPIALLIANGYFIYGGILLIIFGLFDTLDGELSRLQGTSSRLGMLLDSVTDRMKEVLLYIAIAYFLVWSGQAYWAVWAVAACGASLLVSYLNAMGEVVTSDVVKTGTTNKRFRKGLMSFDVRIVVIILGLLSNHIVVAVVVVALLAWQTALTRLLSVRDLLKNAKN